MSSRKARRTKDKGQSPESLVRSPSSIVHGLESLVVLSAFAALVLCTGCDVTPPTCQITSPVDSAEVNGAVPIAATVSDSGGVERVEFYADGSLVGTDSSASYSASWDASSLTEGSWHSLSCIAYDFAQNQGYSDTVAVVIGAIGQRSVFHGELEVRAQTREVVYFDAGAGDTLSGEARVVSGGTLTKFVWLDQDNYVKFTGAQPYTALFEKGNLSEASLRQAVPSIGRYYLAFVNAGSATVKCWARFVLE